MGEPVRKASGRTFHPMSTLVSDACWSSSQVESSHSLKTSNQPPSEALKSGLPMAVFATVKLTCVPVSGPAIYPVRKPRHLCRVCYK